MSLMNDALRKKRREMTAPARLAHPDVLHRPRPKSRWILLLSMFMLITGGTLGWIYLPERFDPGAGTSRRPISPVRQRRHMPTQLAQPDSDRSMVSATDPGDATTAIQASTTMPVSEHPNRTVQTSGKCLVPLSPQPAATTSVPSPHGVATVQSTAMEASNAPAEPETSVPSNGRRLHAKAISFHRDGHIEQAIGLYRQALAAEPEQTDTMLNLAAALMARKDFKAAQNLLDRLATRSPRPRGVLLNRAITRLALGSPQAALDDLDTASSTGDAEGWEIRFHRAVALSRLGRRDEALVILRQLAQARPEDALIRFNLAIALDEVGDYENAASHYLAVLRSSPPPAGADPGAIKQRIGTLRHYLNTTHPSPRRQ